MAHARIKIRDGWEGAGRTGDLYMVIRPARGGHSGPEWSVVMWDDEVEIEPDLHKTAGLEPV
jgi:hypothetical protein